MVSRRLSLGAIWSFLVLFRWQGYLAEEVECENDGPLGMVSGVIADSQITASTVFSAEQIHCETKYARLYQQNGFAWCPASNSSSEWLQVDLGVMTYVTGVMTQGRSDGREWVAQFRLSYSADGSEDHYIADSYGTQQIFEGNVDSYTVKHNYLEQPIKARFLKFHIHTWHAHPSLRVEILGCQKCNRMLGLPPYTRLASSTSKGKKVQKTCTEEYGHLYSNKGWCAVKKDTHQYLEFDIGPPTLITAIITKGRGDGIFPQWVKRYRISYSNDSERFFFYKVESGSGPLAFSRKREAVHQVFTGNYDRDTPVIHYLKYPFVARFVRFHPLEWENRIAMRAGLLGCHYKGECGKGFLRINNQSNCVANLAFKKSAWLNTEASRHIKKRHSSFTGGDGWSAEVDTSASRAVDGVWPIPNQSVDRQNGRYSRENNQDAVAMTFGRRDELLQNCTLLEYKWPYTNPVLHVDLRKETLVYGVIIHTPGDPDAMWNQGLLDYDVVRRFKNLDRFVVKVGNHDGGMNNDSPVGKENPRNSQDQFCGEVTRLNKAVFQPRIHIPCHHPIRGRYVKIETRGSLSGTYGKNYDAALCEVMVY